MRREPYPAPMKAAPCSPALRQPARGKPAALPRRPAARRTRVASPAPWSAPLAINLEGEVAGLAVRQGDGFVFFSAAPRTDALDGVLFSSPAAIREAARRMSPLPKPRIRKGAST